MKKQNSKRLKMETQKSKRRRSRDRLSELPDSLIFNIFELLPMNDVVKTTILSKRWKDLWTTAPFLNFTDYSFKDDPDDPESSLKYPDIEMVQDFVDEALTQWGGINILKFKIDFRSYYDHEFDDDLDEWVRWAKEKQVEEIHLRIENDYRPYDLPECLYSCSSLKVLVLSLKYICFSRIRGNIKWDSLKSLTISDYLSLDPYFITQALRGSPNLEVFNLTLHASKSVCIQSKSLKKLCICKRFSHRDKEKVVEIVTPNLETLEISGYPDIKYVLSASSSLTDVTLRFREDKESWLSSSASFEHDCGETLSQILPTIQHVERLKLSSRCIQVLQRTNKKHLLSRPYFIVRDPVEIYGLGWCFDK
ncbi:putative F-box protein At3g44060 [Salvia miltiorrhiza]|uniref:putative F-box protein At3g44060 n=1 Tax=Salvia miltiorrhiza TaxID=226208 RepID=UPI0025ACDDD1|nr:putative F-box protein At3g44060 [Salvia miltiorrhiza]